MLQRAAAIDPGMAQAYAFQAIVGGAEYANGWNDRMEDLEHSLALARKACEVDPFEAFGHHALAITLMWLRRLDEAETEARRAIELDPNSSEARAALGNALHYGGSTKRRSSRWSTRFGSTPDSICGCMLWDGSCSSSGATPKPRRCSNAD
jgi:tetratricopeptide (TPR) repeat protein